MIGGNLSTRRRLAVLILVLGSVSVAVESTGFFLYEQHSLRRSVVAHAATVAAIAGAAAAPDAEGNSGSAETSLKALASDPRVMEARVYDSRGVSLAEYRRAGSAATLPILARAGPSTVFAGRELILRRAIRSHGANAGTVAIVLDLQPQQAASLRDVRIVLLILGAVLFLRIAMAQRLARVVTKPLDYLAGIARTVTRHGDYTVRAEPQGHGEVLELIGAFNQMLDQIQFREQARQAAEESLRESEERYALAMRGANEGLWDHKVATGELYVSPSWNRMVGEPEERQWASLEEWLGRVHPGDRKRLQEEVEAHLAGHRLEFTSEYRLRHSSGDYLWVISRGIAARDESGLPVRVTGSICDITARKTTDGLTGLPNRVCFLGRLEQAAREGPCAVLYVDLDQFRLVNESVGRAAGDDLLTVIASRLRGVARSPWGTEGDIVAEVARTGGDEFAMMMRGNSSEATAEAMAARVLDRLRDAFHIEGQRMSVSASLGIAMGAAGADPEELLRNADTAMQHAKARGNGGYALFQPDMRNRAVARLETETGLRRAPEAGQLVLHYQPVVRLSENRIVGFESLLRWRHPERGLLPPGEFIPIAEETDLILPIGRWVLREACRQMAEWQSHYSEGPRFTIGVNVSARQVSHASLVDEVASALAESGLNPQQLRLELTESSLITHPDQTLENLRALRRMKVGLVIDDFGTGYSSLGYLHRFPFDTLKIDRTFTRELETDGGGGAEIVRTILALGRSLRMKVIVEGVETTEQLKALKTLGCDFFQGFYFARPADADETERHFHTGGLIFAEWEPEMQPAAVAANARYLGAGQIV